MILCALSFVSSKLLCLKQTSHLFFSFVLHCTGLHCMVQYTTGIVVTQQVRQTPSKFQSRLNNQNPSHKNYVIIHWRHPLPIPISPMAKKTSISNLKLIIIIMNQSDNIHGKTVQKNQRHKFKVLVYPTYYAGRCICKFGYMH